MQQIVEDISEIVERLPFDLRAEVVIASMLEKGLDRDILLVSSRGLFSRKFSRDIERISVVDIEPAHKYALVEINREGIYEAIPQAITHSARRHSGPGRKTGEEMASEVRERRKEENAAKKFFLPFENEFHQLRVDLEIEERNILKGFLSSSRYTALLNRFWQLPAILTAGQKATFLYLIPILYKSVGNFPLTKLCYEAILGTKVEISERTGIGLKSVDACEMQEGKLTLGVNFVCGTSYHSDKPLVNIAIGPLTAAQFQEYLPGGKGLEIVAFLNDYYLPFDVDVQTSIVADTTAKPFVLSENNEMIRLGHTTYI